MNAKLSLSKIDYWALFLFPVFAAGISFFLNVSYLFSIILFYAVPGIYVSLRYSAKWQIAKSFLFSIVSTIPFAVIVGFIGIKSGLWYVPSTVFPQRFLGIIPWEDFIWMIIGVYTIVIIYVTFLDKSKKEYSNREVSKMRDNKIVVTVEDKGNMEKLRVNIQRETINRMSCSLEDDLGLFCGNLTRLGILVYLRTGLVSGDNFRSLMEKVMSGYYKSYNIMYPSANDIVTDALSELPKCGYYFKVPAGLLE